MTEHGDEPVVDADVEHAPEDGHGSAAKPEDGPARIMPVRFGSPWLRVLFTALVFGWFVGHGGVVFSAWMGLIVGVSLIDRFVRSWFREKEVALVEGQIRVGGKRFAKREIKAAIPMHEKERLFVRLSRSLGRTVDMEVHTEAEADNLLSELGLSAESSAMSFMVRSAAPSRKALAMLPFAVIALFWVGGNAIFASSLLPLGAFLIAGLFMLSNRLQQQSLIVGTDGVQLNGLMKSVFYKHSAIAGVTVDGAKITLELRSGEPIELTTSREKRGKPQEVELARRIHDRIVAARRASEGQAAEMAGVASLERGGRTVREWLEFLRRVGDGAEQSFRKAAVSRADLLGTLEDPSARAIDRFAAAVSLARNLTEEEKPRVRVAIDACAEQKLAKRLRVVIEEPSEEALEKALLEAETEAEGLPGRGSRGAL